MSEYHKIDSVYKRDPETKHKTFIVGDYANPAFEYLANNQWMFTEKVDGTNIRIQCSSYIEDGKSYGMSYGGRTDAAQIPATLLLSLDKLFKAEEQRARLAEMFPDGAVLYGEGYGAKIQKGGGNYRQDQSFVLFDVKVGDWMLERANVEDVAYKLGLDIVPIIGYGTLHDMIDMVQGNYMKSTWGNFQAEGIVARPTTELRTRSGHRIITKVKCKDFVLEPVS